ncbi:PadR family transcriptional regulator [Microvirga tunisiensis]|uniref:PadR family transcriptional regulator n=2 Tax=Pannonibacter tanglangensis TaxID=2750084 RepID=A0ABW9ZD89_9HYPH|nr:MULTISPECIES: PadR family transcriptional regulator [unclassified Pannonibacter]NBN62636.1 PadR family transcriptional regulator [Pannonibacter sp. XCT-34]NBN78291.1 PadR family transcriptional regulator [Pannonibacter sp. XCT-53]
MSVRRLCLAILNFGDATGYEIRKASTEGEFSYFEEASFGSIYPTLARLEAEGLVTVRLDPQDGKPARKVYSLTQAGRQELKSLLSEPLAKDTFRSPFLLVAMCADLVGGAVVRRAIDRHMDQIRTEIAQLKEMTADCDHPATLWTIKCGITCMEQNLAYLEGNRAALERMADAGPVCAGAGEAAE